MKTINNVKSFYNIIKENKEDLDSIIKDLVYRHNTFTLSLNKYHGIDSVGNEADIYVNKDTDYKGTFPIEYLQIIEKLGNIELMIIDFEKFRMSEFSFKKTEFYFEKIKNILPNKVVPVTQVFISDGWNFELMNAEKYIKMENNATLH